MNIETVVNEIKAIVSEATGYPEHCPRASQETKREAVPNTGVFRVVVVGTGRQKAFGGCDRYTDLIAVVMRPLSAMDSNKSNLDAATETENLITDLADYDSDDTLISEEIDSEISRENGRVVSSLAFRVSYKLS